MYVKLPRSGRPLTSGQRTLQAQESIQNGLHKADRWPHRLQITPTIIILLLSLLVIHVISLLYKSACSVDEYIKGDDNLPVCTDLDSDTWDANFLSQLGQQEKESEDEDDENEPQPPPLKIQTYKEAIESLENVQLFHRTPGTYRRCSVSGVIC